jgi:TonB family protein
MLSSVLSCVWIIGWVLLHFLWQAGLVGVIYLGIRWVLPRGEWRYRFGMGTLIALAACPVFTGWWLLESAVSVGRVAVEKATLAAPMSAVVASAGLDWSGGLDALLPWFVLAWSSGVLLQSLRTWRQWRRLKVLVCMAEQAPLWQSRLKLIAGRFGLRRHIAVRRSKLVVTPILVGWIRPVILLPMAVACDFPVTQVELILAHELAHLKRLDPVANLFQVALETLYFYHPVVHWISRDVRNEREICCDQLALFVTGGNRHEFAATLVDLGELRERSGSLSLAANGGALLDRVQYMVLYGQQVERRRTPAGLVAVLLGVTLIALTVRLWWNQPQRHELATATPLKGLSAMAPLVITTNSPMIPSLDVTAATFLPQLRPLRPLPVIPSRQEPAAEVIEKLPLTAPATMRLGITVSSWPAVVPMAALPKMASIATMTAPSSPVPTPRLLRPTHIRSPIYPQMALTRGIEGKVVIEFGLNSDGGLRYLRIVHAEPAGIFDQAAMRAMRGWKYPAQQDSTMQRRYRQVVAFVLNTAMAGGHKSSAAQTGDEEIRAHAACKVVTGTHICRWPSDHAGLVRKQL